MVVLNGAVITPLSLHPDAGLLYQVCLNQRNNSLEFFSNIVKYDI